MTAQRRAEVVPIRPLPPPVPAEVAVSSKPKPALDARWTQYARYAAGIVIVSVLLAAIVGGLASFASMIL